MARKGEPVRPLFGVSLAPETAHLSTILQAADEAARAALTSSAFLARPGPRRPDHAPRAGGRARRP
jgi:hypothetical protein